MHVVCFICYHAYISFPIRRSAYRVRFPKIKDDKHLVDGRRRTNRGRTRSDDMRLEWRYSVYHECLHRRTRIVQTDRTSHGRATIDGGV